MIPISPEFGFVIYLSVWFAVLFFFWAREIARDKINSWDLSKDRLYTCDKCHNKFTTGDRDNIARCPKCNNICFARKKYF